MQTINELVKMLNKLEPDSYEVTLTYHQHSMSDYASPTPVVRDKRTGFLIDPLDAVFYLLTGLWSKIETMQEDSISNG